MENFLNSLQKTIFVGQIYLDMLKIKFFITSLTLVILLGTACSSSNSKTSNSSHKVVVISSFYSPVIRGAGASKGMKIGIQLIAPSSFTLDSLTYEGITKEITVVKSAGDTLWTESYFYPNSKNTEEQQTKEHVFSANTCVLQYTNGKKAMPLMVTDMQLSTDSQFWK